jgi:hypothetical protein
MPSVSYIAFTCRPQSHRHDITASIFFPLLAGALLFVREYGTELEV